MLRDIIIHANELTQLNMAESQLVLLTQNVLFDAWAVCGEVVMEKVDTIRIRPDSQCSGCSTAGD